MPADPDLTVLPLVKSDAMALSDLHAQCFDEGDRWSRDSFSSLLDDRLVYGLKLLQKGELVGFLLGRCVAGEGEILTVAVTPALRQAGLGTALLAAMFERARQQGCHDIFLEVAADNQAAIGLYRKFHFVECGRRRAYYANTTDALLMKCTDLNK